MSESSSNTPNRARWCELIDQHLLGTISKDDAIELEAVLASSRDAREAYRLRCNVDAALRQEASAQPMPTRAAALKPARWLSWRPLTAAAAGIVFGMFCTSVVFGYVVQRGLEKKTPLAMFQPSFEDTQMPFAKGFPDASAHWGGDEARVVMAENGIQAKEGRFMLRLDASPKGSPRIVYQVLDLTSLPSSGSNEMREIEITASFAAADAATSVRYMLRAFAASETRENLDAAWFEHRDEAIASATRGLDVLPGAHGWQTFGLRIQVPHAARNLVLFFGARTPDKTLPKAAHYIDDVQVSFIEPQPLP
ncbi:MAG: hypothetical protein ACKVY0_03805 [Prosthecobacter sp.]|uniref:hypothetical protein n=1 Tax=Prosthecobacter sp. TaxID=1965333 RepID=UPI0039035407